MPVGSVHTLGDSTLDNLFWMLPHSDLASAKKSSVEGQLQERVKADGYKVCSHAYDGFTTKSVLEGDQIGAVLPYTHEKPRYMKEKASQGQYVHPLKELEKEVAAKPDAPHYVVVSVGGNDFRENLLNPWRLLKDIPQIQERYLQIVDKVKGLQGKNVQPILMLQYRTDANQDHYGIYSLFGIIGSIAVIFHLASLALLTAPIWIVAGKVSAVVGGTAFFASAAGLYLSRKILPLSVTKDVFLGKKVGMALFGALLHSFYQPILERAKKENIPVLDLSNTFNPYRKLYDCGIEPNKEGGALIAEGIAHILKNHDFRGGSVLYSKPDKKPTYTGIANTNPAAWRVACP